jgi:hypothetical protein
MGLKGLLIDFNAIAVWVGPLAEMSDFPIDPHLSRLDHLFGLPSGGQAILRQNFLQSLCHNVINRAGCGPAGLSN